MSDFTEATVDDIRDADPETLNRWASGALGLEPYPDVTLECKGEHRSVWSNCDPWETMGADKPDGHIELPASSGNGPGVEGEPPAFCSDWSAAGVLLEAIGEATQNPMCADFTPETITRTYLVSIKRGTLEALND